jgi:hypothetical protein
MRRARQLTDPRESLRPVFLVPLLVVSSEVAGATARARPFDRCRAGEDCGLVTSRRRARELRRMMKRKSSPPIHCKRVRRFSVDLDGGRRIFAGVRRFSGKGHVGRFSDRKKTFNGSQGRTLEQSVGSPLSGAKRPGVGRDPLQPMTHLEHFSVRSGRPSLAGKKTVHVL